jgi:two-component system, response regulator
MPKTILLVEDNPSDEKLALFAFKKTAMELQVAVVRDGAEALAYLFRTDEHQDRDSSAIPALILLDLGLPRISGLDVLRRIREDHRTKTIPVVVLSASSEPEDIAQCYRLGTNAYVRKPIDFAEFTRAAATIAHFWLGMNERAPVRQS